jgi:hypothetical protein
MSDLVVPDPSTGACTQALRRVLPQVRDHVSAADLLFLERWEMYPLPGAAVALRVAQLRRANPELAAEIRAEVRTLKVF